MKVSIKTYQENLQQHFKQPKKTLKTYVKILADMKIKHSVKMLRLCSYLLNDMKVTKIRNFDIRIMSNENKNVFTNNV